jgi:hypothetical protein
MIIVLASPKISFTSLAKLSVATAKLPPYFSPSCTIPTVEVKRLQTRSDSTLQELEETKKKIATLQESQNIEDIPQLVDDIVGPIKVTNLSKIHEYDRRDYQIQ